VESTGWVNKGKLEQGTHIILNATPTGNLAAEAISPGTLASRKTTFIGCVKGSKLLTRAVFNAILGDAPVDVSVKAQAGKSFLWAANGLPFKPKVFSKGLVASLSDDGEVRLPREYKVEQLPKTSSLFSLAADNKQTRMLLNRLALE